MSWRVVVVSGMCKLESKLGYLVCRGEEVRKVFLQEIDTLIIESTAVSLTAALLCELIRGMAEKHNLAGHLRRAADPEETDPLGLLKQWMLQHSTLEAQKLFTSNLGLVVRAVFDGTETENALRERVHEMLLERDQILSAAVVNAVNHRQLPSNADVELICSFLTYILNGYCNVDRFGFRAQDQENVYQRLVDFCFDELSQLKRRSSVRRRGSALGLAHLQLS